MEGGSGDWGFDIDGSVLEGGGQILRIAVALSALLQKTLRVHRIRAGRKTPGLSNQHLRGLELVQRMCNGSLRGGQLQSEEISFSPGKLTSGEFIADAATAGSVCLLLQIALPCALFANGATVLRLRGGTNADFAPPVDYVEKVLLPILTRFGIQAEMNILRRGYYPKGGGEIIVKVNPVAELSAVRLLERGTVSAVSIFSYVAGQLPVHVSEECANHAEMLLSKQLPGLKINKIIKKETTASAVGTGSGAFVWAETSTGCVVAGSSNGSRTKHSKEVAVEAANMVITAVSSNVCVDEHLQDQLIIFMALAKGYSEILTGPLTLHTQTAIFVCEKMLGVQFRLNAMENGNQVIGCEGVGFRSVSA
ncbi:RNA 3'-terminal phosphate cyclase-like isoform X2 [Paramacrobiotus metropolitanus]|uniref:RNA 3'-terminal phosphate cyclase-like isoform X2 n=1 Tax=Paramacrobiotus metropolitanus TaxID=2943436 RepID=UPI00244565E4|nr:RNA 3'-terminal phosphate cyclase-like isoform X2 [Paramacrobiotus metropolitanus]